MTHFGKERNILSLSGKALAYILSIAAKRVAGGFIEMQGPILGHSGIAVKLLALQGGIYNVCGMYNV